MSSLSFKFGRFFSIIALVIVVSGCKKKEEAASTSSQTVQSSPTPNVSPTESPSPTPSIADLRSLLDPTSKKVAARIGEKIITLGEVDTMISRQPGINSLLQMATESPGLLDQFRISILEKMIDRELLASVANKAATSVPKEEIDKIKEQMLQRFGDEENMKAKLAEAGLTMEGLMKQIEADLSIKYYIRDEISNKLEVSDSELQKAYDENPEKFGTPTAVSARHILIKVDPNASPEETEAAKNKAQQVYEKTKADKADFSAIAREMSDDKGSATTGGNLGVFTKGKMVKEFEDTAFSMNEGDISKPVKTQFGYHIIKVDKRREGKIVPFNNIKEQVKNTLIRERQVSGVENKLKELRTSSNVVIELPQPGAVSQ